MKKTFYIFMPLFLVTMLLVSTFPSLSNATSIPAHVLADLTHNIKNTGIMLPEKFDPYVDTYLLTVASWVSRVKFTPFASSSEAVITVNGQEVEHGKESQIIKMTDKPQRATIKVKAFNSDSGTTEETTYTVFLQRRPSERRTRVSAGYITDIVQKKDVYNLHADLVTLTYKPNTNIATYENKADYIYKYDCAENCLFYYGTGLNPLRAYSAQEFMDYYDPNILYFIIYIEDNIVAVMPF